MTEDRFAGLRREALEIFDGPETSQDVRDVIEWYTSSLAATVAQSATVPADVAGMVDKLKRAFRSAGDFTEVNYADEFDMLDSLARLAAQGQRQGWQWVPMEPTRAMLRPFFDCPHDELPLAWQAALIVAESQAKRAPTQEADDRRTPQAAQEKTE